MGTPQEGVGRAREIEAVKLVTVPGNGIRGCICLYVYPCMLYTIGIWDTPIPNMLRGITLSRLYFWDTMYGSIPPRRFQHLGYFARSGASIERDVVDRIVG